MCRFVPEILSRSGRAAAVLAFALLGAAPSQAGLMVDQPAPRRDFFTVDFDLSDSTLTFGGVGVNGMNAMVSGRLRLELDSLDAMGRPAPTPGSPGRILDLSLRFDLDRVAISGFDAALLGPVTLSQAGITSTQFTGEALIVQPTLFTTRLMTNLDCVGSQCAFVAAIVRIQFPLTTNTLMSNDMGPFFFTLDGLTSGQGFLQASIDTMSGPLSVRIDIRGRQVPEPTATGLLMCAALAMCGALAVGRLRAH